MKFQLNATAVVLIVGAVAGGTFLGVKGFEWGVHHYIVSHPEVLLEAGQALDKQQAVLAQKKEAAAVARAKTLIPQHRDQIFHDARDPFVGPANAKVTVVQFADYRCPHCKVQAAPAMLALISKYPDVKFVFKEWPIFGPSSEIAARAAIGASRQGKYLPVFQALMAEPSLDASAVNRILQTRGLDPAKTMALGSTPEVSRQLSDTEYLAKLLGAEGTPAFVVGDTMVPGARMDEVEALIQKARKG